MIPPISPFAAAHARTIGTATLLLAILVSHGWRPAHWVSTALVFVLFAPAAGLLARWSDCPQCGKSAFHHRINGSRHVLFARFYSSWPDRMCTECGYRLDRRPV